MADQKQCLRCGTDKPDFGRLKSYGGVTFASWAKTIFGIFGPTESLSAYACRNCGHVELVLDRPK
jgi:hypothetical protein